MLPELCKTFLKRRLMSLLSKPSSLKIWARVHLRCRFLFFFFSLFHLRFFFFLLYFLICFFTCKRISETPKGKTRNFHFCEFWVTDPFHWGEMIKFSMNKRYNGKTRVLNNQQLKRPTQVKDRESLNFVFLFS